MALKYEFLAHNGRMPAAKYVIHVPAQDELGRPLRLHEAVHNHLGNLGAKPVQIHQGTPYHTVTGWAEDTPEWDSTAKQTGVFAGEVANVPAVHVTKEGDKSAAWEMANPHYQTGLGAEDYALAPNPLHSIHAQLACQASGR